MLTTMIDGFTVTGIHHDDECATVYVQKDGYSASLDFVQWEGTVDDDGPEVKDRTLNKMLAWARREGYGY